MEEGTLRQWRRLLLEEISELQRQLEPLARELQHKREKVAAVEKLLALESAAAYPRENGGGRQRLADLARQALIAAGRPMHYKEICAAIIAEGITIPGKDPATNLIAHMGVDARFKRIKRGTYSLAHWETPPGQAPEVRE